MDPALRRALQDLSRRIGTTSDWKALPLTTGWTAFAQTVQSRLAGEYVEIRGNIAWSTGAGAANPLTTLPIGQRPLAELDFPSTLDVASTTFTPLNITISTNGEIKIWGLGASAGKFGLNLRFAVG